MALPTTPALPVGATAAAAAAAVAAAAKSVTAPGPPDDEARDAPMTAAAIDRLYLADPPPLDPVWLAHERALNLPNPRPVLPALERQPVYARECRALTARMTAPGARDHHLAQGVAAHALTVPSTLDGFAIPLLAYALAGVDDAAAVTATATVASTGLPAAGPASSTAAGFVVFYIHGGGLHIGEADSEELSCRRILKDARLPAAAPTATTATTAPPLAVYSVGYRLMPQHPASTCVADCLDAYRAVAAAHPAARLLVVGSSSGGELAAFVAQDAGRREAEAAAGKQQHRQLHRQLQGVVLRCPVTSDAFNGLDGYVPAAVRPLHTSATNGRFQTTLLGPMRRLLPRDGLPAMPLEAPPAVLQTQPRHWIQVCTNDMLYSDGVCYAKALAAAGVPVQVDAVVGWPHTFWLKTPWMDRALEAEQAMLRGLAWVAGG